MTDFDLVKKVVLRFVGFRAKIERNSQDLVLRDCDQEVNGLLTRSLTAPQIDREGFIFRCLLGRSVVGSFKDASVFSEKLVFEKIFLETEEELKKETNGKQFIYFSVVTRFWLSCFVASQMFYMLLIAPMKDKEWISFDDFKKCIENIHQRNIARAFLSDKEDKKYSFNLRIQKMLFFFCLVEFDVRQINAQGIVKVLELSNRNAKGKDKEFRAFAEGFIHRASQRRKVVSPVIRIDEFYWLLVTSLTL